MVAQIQGAEQLDALAHVLKDWGEVKLNRQLTGAITKATKPAKQAIRDSARRKLPKRGGLADVIARSRLSTSKRKGGVRIRASSKHSIKKMDQGILRHPVFADSRLERNAWTWVNQDVEAGWFTDPLEELAPEVRDEILKAMNDVIAELGRRV